LLRCARNDSRLPTLRWALWQNGIDDKIDGFGSLLARR
jgi:hypothetical protein